MAGMYAYQDLEGSVMAGMYAYQGLEGSAMAGMYAYQGLEGNLCRQCNGWNVCLPRTER